MITVRSDIVGRTIECLYDDGATSTLVGRMMITAIIGDHVTVYTALYHE